jgi:hypothetical protein
MSTQTTANDCLVHVMAQLPLRSKKTDKFGAMSQIVIYVSATAADKRPLLHCQVG